MRLGQTIVIAAVLTLALSRIAGRAQTAPAPTIKVYSRETIVDVTVTDAKGNPVHGLKREDFTVKEDGKPQPIRSFAEYGSQAVPEPPKLPPNVYTNLQPPPASSATNVLLLDFTNMAPVMSISDRFGPGQLAGAIAGQNHIKQEAMKYLKGMPTGTRVAVLGAAYPSRLRILQGVTSDPALLSAAVDTMAYDTDAMAIGYDSESWCYQQEMRNRMTIETLMQVAVDLEAIKGRKNLIWFVSDMSTVTDPAQRPSCLTDPSRDLRKVYGVLAAAQVTVFLVSGGPLLSSETIAEDAGGVALYGSSDLASLIAKAVDSGSDYYTLSYVPPASEYDGRHHTIKLAVDRPGLQLAYRGSYYAEDPTKISNTPGAIPGLTLAAAMPEAYAGDIRAAMSRSMPTSQQLLFDVQVEPSTTPFTPPILGTLDAKLAAVSLKKAKSLTRYSFQYAIPARQITFKDGPNGVHKGAMELDIAAYDGDGKLVTGLSQTVQMPLSDARYQEFIKGPFRFVQQLDLPTGALFLRIGILDGTSNKIGTLEIPVTVASK